jgi:hypothetical protein
MFEGTKFEGLAVGVLGVNNKTYWQAGGFSEAKDYKPVFVGTFRRLTN